MADEQEQASASEERDENEERTKDEEGTKENNRPDDTLASEKKCPECGEPVDDVRATCINCGYEYTDEDHEDPDAGSEFVAGSQIDDEGNEMPDEEPPAEPEGDTEGDEE